MTKPGLALVPPPSAPPSPPPATPQYIELRCKSAFSFLQGACLPEPLVQRAVELGYPALALGDRGGMYGIPRFSKAAKKAGLRPIISAELQVEGHPLLLLCENAQGYRNLCRLLTQERMRPRLQGAAAQPLTLATLAPHVEGLFALTGGLEGQLGSALQRRDGEQAHHILSQLREVFGPAHVAVELQVHFDDAQDQRNHALVQLAQQLQLPLVLTNDVLCATSAQLLLCDVLACVREKTTLDQAGTRLLQNAERYLKSPQEMAALLPELPQALANSVLIAERCQFDLRELSYRFPTFALPPQLEGSQADFLRTVVFEAAPSRFRPYTDRARAQLERELQLIEKLGLSGYFLIVWDIIQFCKSRGILSQGRGSAANSAVCFALSITACDPLKMDLLFERFLSEERGEWPDIDLDFPSGARREEVIQYLYRKYGAAGCALTANVITYRGRSAVRDVGKALALPNDLLDQLAGALSRWEGDDTALADYIAEAGIDAKDSRVAQLLQVWREIQDLPRHLGQHPGGMIIAAGRLDEVVPLEPASMADRVIIQWDKEDVADLGIVKIDLLGLGMMAALEEAVRLCPAVDGVPFDMAALPADDPAVYRMLSQADTVGVFQIESRAQMAILPRVKPSRFYDLVVQVGLIRPGPIVGKMVHPYLRRRCGEEAVRFPHPSLEPILARTLGIPLFQEQVMRVAMVAAGFTGGQAELLRRAMDSKRGEAQMQAMIAQLREGMQQKQLPAETAEEIVTAVTSFAQYGFPESHAISFATITYASAYLKTYHPGVFYTTLLNAWPMGFYHPSTLVKDAQRHGVRVLPIEINASQIQCTLQREEDSQSAQSVHSVHQESQKESIRKPARLLRVGLRFVRGLSEKSAQAIAQARQQAPFHSLSDFKRRCPSLSAQELSTLAEIGAFTNLEGRPSRRDALWQVSELSATREGLLMGASASAESAHSPLATMSLAERISADHQGATFTVGPHPLALIRPVLQAAGVLPATALLQRPNGAQVQLAGIVIVRQRPPTARGFFFVTLEDETGLTNLIVAPQVFEENRAVLLGCAALLVTGQLQNQHGAISVKGLRFADLAQGLPPASAHSTHPQAPRASTLLQTPTRDFH